MQWSVEDEINFCKWFDSKGFKLCWLPQLEQWGYYHNDRPKVVMGGFNKLIELKQHLVDLKGERKNVSTISQDHAHKALEEIGGLPKLH